MAMYQRYQNRIELLQGTLDMLIRQTLRWVPQHWRTSEHNQRAKYYQLTAAGKKQLTSEYSRWNRMSGAIASLMNSAETEGQA